MKESLKGFRCRGSTVATIKVSLFSSAISRLNNDGYSQNYEGKIIEEIIFKCNCLKISGI